MTASVETLFTENDGLSIAYQVWGDGPRNLVLVPGMISHLEAFMEHPGYLQWMTSLSSAGRLVTFDKRGNGMSDRIQGTPTLEERMMDIEAVMDVADMPSATIIAFSEGASLACVYAAMRPQRVERLALCGGYAQGRLTRGYLTPESLELALAQFRENWGKPYKPHPFSEFGPSQDDAEAQEAWAHFQRMSATPITVANLFELAAWIDIRELLPSISQSTLVIHRETEEANGADCAQDFLRLMPKTEYKTIPGHEHVPWEGDVESYAAAIVEFVTGAAPVTTQPTRTLTTVLFSDLVESTSQQARIGDDRWRDLMNRHDDICATQISRHGGHLVKFTGDGVVATFSSPTSALTCAGSVREALSAIDLNARFGAHTGEIEMRGDDISGLGVVVAARVMGQAKDGQVLTSDLTRQLMLGAPFQFQDCGEHELKGVPNKWRLHEVSPAS
ncbi:adenylate/guanylate cyclase domain-containing protein [Ruegeria sp. MALMAid1280]|uniref:adenylate/guanylate cyclase domain-containing protein n=1 Tax=Ruegeria sp. MALMAid1280 TaxID=3411634 RepID=UPI003BA14089